MRQNRQLTTAPLGPYVTPLIRVVVDADEDDAMPLGAVRKVAMETNPRPSLIRRLCDCDLLTAEADTSCVCQLVS